MKSRIVRGKQLQYLGIALISLALVASTISYFFLSYQHGEPYYMMSCLFAFMGMLSLSKSFL